MKKISKWLTMLTFIFCLSSFVIGQERTGNIEGNITDPNGASVPGAVVQITGLSIGFNRGLTTNESGNFRLLQVPPGTYKITVTANGFKERSSEVSVSLGQTSNLSLKLEIGSGVVTVDVTGTDSAVIDSENNRVQTTVSERQIELTPKANINFSGVLRVSPAVREEPLGAGFNIDGSSGAENTFIVDGLEVTNFRTGQLRNVQNISTDAVSEVQVKTSGFEAEFGGATGGVVNVVSKGGENGLHGQIGSQFEIDKFNADSRPILRGISSAVEYVTPGKKNNGTFLSPPDDKFTNFFPTVRLGGSIIRDRLWFFGSAAPQYREQERTSIFQNGTSQTNTQKQRNDFLFGRLDSQPFEKLRITGTYSYSPQTINGNVLAFGATAPIAGLSERGGRVNANNFTYSGVYTPVSSWVISVRGGRAYQNEKDGSYGVPSGFRVRCAGNQTVLNTVPNFGCGPTNSIGFDNIGNTANVNKDISIRNTFDADASVVVNNFGGRHIFKFGYQFNKVTNDVDNGFFAVGQLQFRFGESAFGVGSALGNVQLTKFGTFGKTSSNNTGLFVQDSWQIARRLTLNLGIRIEKELVPSFSENGVPIEFGWGSKPAPRFGFAYDIFGDGKTKVFASYGWFYDRFKFELPRGSFGGDQFLRYYAPIISTDINTYTYDFMTNPANLVLDFRVPSNDPSDNRIDPDLKAQRQSEFTVGFERELWKNIILRGRYTHKQLDSTIEDVGFFDNAGNENFFIANPGEGLVSQPFASGIPATPKAERKFDAIEVTFDKRFSNNYFLNTTYTWSRLFGNYSGLASSDERGRSSPNVNRFFDLPFLGFNLNGEPDNGRLATDRPHAVKVFGGYSYNWFKRTNNSTDFTVAFLGTSGTPISSQVAYFNANTFVFERGDLGRTETFTQTDFAITHRYKFGADGKFGMAFEVNIINLFNEKNVVDLFNFMSSGSFSGQQGNFNLYSNCGGACDELNTIRAIFNGGIRTQFLNYLNNTVDVDPGAGVVNDSIVPDARYKSPLTFQDGRQVRFGFRFFF